MVTRTDGWATGSERTYSYESPDSFTTLDGKTVYVKSNARASGYVLRYMPEVIPLLDIGDVDYVVKESQRAKEVGRSAVIETEQGNEILFAKRNGYKIHLRCILYRPTQPTNYLTVVLRRIKQSAGGNQYYLTAAWVGRKTPQTPADLYRVQGKLSPEEFEHQMIESKFFWRNHAYVYSAVKYNVEQLVREIPPEWQWLNEEVR